MVGGGALVGGLGEEQEAGLPEDVARVLEQPVDGVLCRDSRVLTVSNSGQHRRAVLVAETEVAHDRLIEHAVFLARS